MIRNIIEYLRKENGISTIDLTLDICSPSMYYAYIKGSKQMSDNKLIALKDRLGADNLSILEVEEYNQELDEYYHGILNYRFDQKSIVNYFETLQDYKTQMLLDERLIVKYLVVTIYFLIALDNKIDLKDYLYIFSLIKKYLNKEQLLQYYSMATYEIDLSYEGLLELLAKIEALLKEVNEDANCCGFIYLTLGKMYLRTHKPYHSQYYIKKAIDNYRKYDCFRGVVATKNIYILHLLTTNKVNEALEEINKNLSRAQELNFAEEIKNCITNQLLYYSLLNKVDDVITQYQELIKILNKEIMYSDYLRLLCILGVLEKYKLERDSNFLLKLIKEKLPPPKSPIYLDLLKCSTIIDEEEKMLHIESVLETYQEIFLGYDWCIVFYCRLINYYECQKRYKKVAEICNKYINHLRKYVQ